MTAGRVQRVQEPAASREATATDQSSGARDRPWGRDRPRIIPVRRSRPRPSSSGVWSKTSRTPNHQAQPRQTPRRPQTAQTSQPDANANFTSFKNYQLAAPEPQAKWQNSRQQLPGEGLIDQQQAALVQLGKMMGPQIDAFDEEVQRLHDIRHQAEHDATDYEKELAE